MNPEAAQAGATVAPNVPPQPWSVLASTLIGAVGFTVVAVGAFSIWAFGSRWFRGHGGEGAMYAAIAAAFIALAGILLHPLIDGPRKVARFYGVFGSAFAVYSVLWSACWFVLKGSAGEWSGAAAGSAAFVAITAWRFGRISAFWPAVLIFFVLHTAGYFAGGKAMGMMFQMAKPQPPASFDKAQWSALAMLSWGVFYGLGFGAGLGYVFRVCQRPPR